MNIINSPDYDEKGDSTLLTDCDKWNNDEE